MSEYTPDAWIVLEFNSKKFGRVQRILAGWSGGYIDGDYWRLSSGITEKTETDTEWIFKNTSGSVYHCRKFSRKLNMASAEAYQRFKEEVAVEDDVTLEVIEFTRDD